MTWRTRYRLRDFFRSSFWIGPIVTLVSAVFIARGLREFDSYFRWKCFEFTPEGARTILGAFVASMLTFVVVVASSLLLLVQLVSASLTPRIIAPTLMHPLIRVALSVFVFAFVFSLAILGRIDQTVPQFAVAAAIVLNLASLILFLYFIGAIGLALRPSSVMTTAASRARNIILESYPSQFDPRDPLSEARPPTEAQGAAQRTINFERSSGVLLAFDATGLVNLARKCDSVVELVPRVGDYVAAGEPLFRIYGANAVEPLQLLSCVVFGPERTMQQDPRMGFRIIVDIACKALSPAINDPTTAVLAVDQIHRLLRLVGSRMLLSGTHTDAEGKVRLIYATPSWHDFVWLGTAELRQFGGGSMRVCQRLRAMLEHLIQTLPEPRRPPLWEQLRLLNQAVDRHFPDTEDRDRIRAGASRGNGASADA